MHPAGNAPINERYPQFSPDGEWFVYSSNERGEEEVFVERFRGAAERYPISTNGGPRRPGHRADAKCSTRRSAPEQTHQNDGCGCHAEPGVRSRTPACAVRGPLRSWVTPQALRRVARRSLPHASRTGSATPAAGHADGSGAQLVRGAEAPRADKVRRGPHSRNQLLPYGTSSC